jgi:hypothetical protein
MIKQQDCWFVKANYECYSYTHKMSLHNIRHHPTHIILTRLKGENNDYEKISSQEKLTFANASISTGIVALNSSV